MPPPVCAPEPASPGPPRGWARHRLPVLLLLAATAALFAPFWLGGRVFVPGDFLAFVYPWKATLAGPVRNLELFDVMTLFVPVDLLLGQGLREGRIPLWNPYIFSGHPVAASGQSGFFYPVRLALHALLDVGAARTVSQALHLALMGTGMYALLVRRGLGPGPALLGGVAWMLNAFATSWMEYEHAPILSALLVWALVALESGRRGVPVAALLLGMSLLAGHLQLNLYALGTVVLYSAFRAWERRSLRGAWQPLVALLAALLIAAPALLPFAEFLPLSARRAFSWEELQTMASPLGMILPTLLCPDAWGNPAAGFLVNRTPQNYVFPEFACFAGSLTLALALGLLADREARRRFGPLYALAGLALLAAAATAPYRLLVAGLPFLAQLIPGRILFLVPFALALLAAEAAERLPGSEALRRAVARTGLALALAWGAWLGAVAWLLHGGSALLRPYMDPRWVKIPAFDPGPAWAETVLVAARGALLANPQAWTSLLLPLALAVLLRSRRLRPHLALVLGGATALELLLFAVRFNPAVPPSALYPPLPSLAFLQAGDPLARVQTDGAGVHDTLVPYRIASVQGYESVVSRRYLDLLEQAEGAGVNIRTGYIQRTDSGLLDMLGVRWLLANPHYPPRDLPVAWKDAGMTVYRRPRALPRAWAVGRVMQPPPDRALEVLAGLDPARVATVEEPVDVDPRAGGSAVRVLDYQTDRVVLVAEMRAQGLVVLADTWFPGWRVRVDGVPARLLRVDHVLRGVQVGPGLHRLEFDYWPRTLTWGLGLAGLGLGLAVGVGWTPRRYLDAWRSSFEKKTGRPSLSR